jgi:hypothetical protein
MAYQASNSPAAAIPPNAPVKSDQWWKNVQQQNVSGNRQQCTCQKYKVRMGNQVLLLPVFSRVKTLGQDLSDLETENPFEDTESFGAGAAAPVGAPVGVSLADLPIAPTAGALPPSGGYVTPSEVASLSPTLTAIPGTGGYSLLGTPASPLSTLAAVGAGVASTLAQQSAAKQTLQQVNASPTTSLSSIPTGALIVGGAVLLIILTSKGGRRR